MKVLQPTFEESLQQYLARCGVDDPEKNATATAMLRAFWSACLNARYAEWKARRPFMSPRIEKVGPP